MRCVVDDDVQPVRCQFRADGGELWSIARVANPKRDVGEARRVDGAVDCVDAHDLAVSEIGCERLERVTGVDTEFQEGYRLIGQVADTS